jgi:hypothetical protein
LIEEFGAMEIPDEAEFAKIPCLTIVESSPQDGFWLYQGFDVQGIELRLSFNILERSVQAVLRADGFEIASVSVEGGRRLELLGGAESSWIKCTFKSASTHGVLQIALRPRIQLRSSTLVDEET